MRWWGVIFSAGSPCTKATDDFKILFFEDDSGQPGTLVSEQVVTPRTSPVGVDTDPAGVTQYEADLNTPVTLADGWISIRGFGDTECFFYWYRSDEGDNSHRRDQNGTVSPVSSDFSLCLLECPLPELGEGEGDGTFDGSGACCVDGICLENIDFDVCANDLGGDYQGDDSLCQDVTCAAEGEGDGDGDGDGGGGEAEVLVCDYTEVDSGSFDGCTADVLYGHRPAPFQLYRGRGQRK